MEDGMSDMKLFEKYRTQEDKEILSSLLGWIIKKYDKTNNGTLILTNKRVAFCSDGIFTKVFRDVWLKHASSVEIKTRLGWRNLTVRSSHHSLSFSMLGNAREFEIFYNSLEKLRNAD